MQPELIQLPNKDLWRGYTPATAALAEADKEVVAEVAQNPVNRAMAQILKAAAGANILTCVWCGQQGAEREMRDHIKTNHKSVIEPSSPSDAALATMATQQKATIEAKANKE